MSLFVQLFLQIGLPAILLIDLFKKEYSQRREWLLDVVLVGVLLLFVFQTARWDWFSYYLRLMLLPVFGLVAYVAYRCIDRKKEQPPPPFSPVKEYINFGVKGFLILVAVVFNLAMVRGSFAPPGAVELSYPLREGIYYVGGGGANRWINGHNAFPPQNYAVDIVRLNAFGNRASGLNPESLEDYTIYGDRIYAPCSGSIVVAEDGHVDNVPPARDTTHLAGNHVVIACEGVEVLLAHMKEGSIKVTPGQDVNVGFVVGEIGNSGHSSQPHLHLHAERGGEAGVILDGEGVPVRFNKRFLVRNSLFSGRAPTK